jgi:hypothetical protein
MIPADAIKAKNCAVCQFKEPGRVIVNNKLNCDVVCQKNSTVGHCVNAYHTCEDWELAWEWKSEVLGYE